ncbi:MAG: thioredoxin domain-containing protein, partial [Candidatus Diapherotrites archaeon]|nr:thioredoxin domain-containing protein [Candidatus Diapherotrites archaeon]
MNEARPNRLLREKSIYLRQHAHNPVEWYPWGPEAFEKAQQENKPVFLSIGYASCHWCHVMEQESFEDLQVAEVLNRDFVSVKVDREERPDIDKVFMQACLQAAGHGGWPLTAALTPEQKPFFIGTYFPKHSQGTHPGLLDLLPELAHAWKTNPEKIIQAGKELRQTLSQPPIRTPIPTDQSISDQTFLALSESFDPEFGGFGLAPKFPSPHQISFLLSYWKQTNHPLAIQMAEKTLQAIRAGGIWDQLAGGIHRYSTDREWRVPHFEKMLSDQALLAMACTECFQATQNELYAIMAQEILEFVLREMQSPEGGFYTSMDADSEGTEGKYYTWSEEEIRKALTPQEADAFISAFGILPEGNFREEASGVRSGQNTLYQTHNHQFSLIESA